MHQLITYDNMISMSSIESLMQQTQSPHKHHVTPSFLTRMLEVFLLPPENVPSAARDTEAD